MRYLVKESAVTAVTNSNPVARKKFTLRRKTITKHGKCKLFLATGFEFVYDIIAIRIGIFL